MKAKFIKKLTAGFVSAIMAVGMMGVTALAKEIIEVNNATENLQNVINNAEDGDTIKFTTDITLTSTLEIPNGKDITIDLGRNKLTGPESGCAIQLGKAENYGKVEGDGTLTIKNGTINGTIKNYYDNIYLEDGLEIYSNSETANAVSIYGGTIEVSGAYIESKGYGIALFNAKYGETNEKEGSNVDDTSNKSSNLTFNYGTVDVAAFGISGNNMASGGTTAIIKGGEIKGLLGIYWPMEGTLDIEGGHIEGGTGIEAKMGTITISGDAEIVGTGEWKETHPENGGSAPEGSAILLSSQMYGAIEGQYKTSKDLTLTINGGKFKSNKGNAITVYNTEDQTENAQITDATINGGEFNGEKADIKYKSIENSENNVNTSVEGNSYYTNKVNTTLTVYSDAAPAAINEGGDTVFYSDVNEAIEAANAATGEEVEVAVYGDAVIDTDVTLNENVKLVVASGAELKAEVSANGNDKVIVTSTDKNGNTVYEIVNETDAEASTYYVAKITSGGNTSFFRTLTEAVKTVQNGQTIELLKNCDGTVEVSKEVSFTVIDNNYDYKIVEGNGYVNVGRGDDYDFITKEDYEDERDSHRHSYSLEEGIPDRDEDEEEPVVTPEPEEEEGPFSDVGKDNPNYDAIVEVYEKGWMAGIGDGVFAPNGTLTRGMAVTILWNRAGQPEPASVAPFLDVTSDAWYAKAVAWAYENGITSGYGDTYGPDDFLTTEQFTRMNDIANGRTPEVYVGGAPNATRGWVAGLLVME